MTHIIVDFLDQQMHIRKESGQAAIEFILTLTFSVGFVVLFLHLALNFTRGYLNHYVNFMASRTYLVHDNGIQVYATVLQRAEAAAEDTFDGYDLPSFGIKANFKVQSRAAGSALFTGTISEFETMFSSLLSPGSDNIHLYSESFLGKEPSRVTCYEMTCAAISGSTSACSNYGGDKDVVLFDNGC